MTLDRHGLELERLRIACHVESAAVVSKAQEILRLMEVKCRVGSLGKGELCRTVVAFDLACRALDCPIPRGTAVKHSAAPEAVYATALGIAQRLLKVERKYTPEEVATEMGDRSVGTMAAKELRRYQERFLDSYPSRQVMSLDLDGTVYAVASFYLCSKKLKHPVDKQRLLDFATVGEEEFTNVCRSMLDLCYSTLGISARDKPREDRPKLHHLTSNLSQNSASVARGSSRPAAASGICTGKTSSSANNGGSLDRRPIPLSRGLGAGAPRSHVAFLARSIQRAATRKRNGGATVIPVEPGDHRPCTNRDTTHNLLPKRSRTSTPTPTVSDHPSTGTQAVLNEVREVDGAQPATEPFNFSHVPSSSAPAESCAISGTECNNPAVTRSTMQSTCALDRGESASNSGARQHLTTGRAWSLHGGQTVGCGSETATDSKARIESYANWKSRALTLMESKVKAASSENDIGRQPPPAVSSEISNETKRSPITSAPTKQGSITAFFALATK